MAELACACHSGAVDRAIGVYVEWKGAGVIAIGRRDDTHRQLALRPDRSSEPVAGSGGIPRPTIRDVERSWPPVGTKARLPVPRRIGWIDLRRGDKAIGPVE